MNRRDFLKSLAGLPLLGVLKPEAAEIDEFKRTQLELIEIAKDIPPRPMIFGDWVEPEPESYEKSLVIGPDGTLYVGGSFISAWNGESWSSLK